MGDERQGGFARRFTTSDDMAMDESLHMLNQRSRPFSTALDFVKIDNRRGPLSQFFGEQICRRNSVLNSKINSYTTGRRHGVRRVADAKQSFAVPFAESIDLHGQQSNF